MRDVLFRGVRTDTGNWCVGYFASSICCNDDYDELRAYIFQRECGILRRVHLETVGQYTGKIDEHGERIFEGDIVRVRDRATYDEIGLAVVAWDSAFAKFHAESRAFRIGFDQIAEYMFEVEGNIYEE